MAVRVCPSPLESVVKAPVLNLYKAFKVATSKAEPPISWGIFSEYKVDEASSVCVAIMKIPYTYLQLYFTLLTIERFFVFF